jgi:uncharacterized membrane protein
MFGMSRKELSRHVKAEKVQEAIKKAEIRTSGEICVSVSPFFWGSVRRQAERAFVRLGITRTKDRNGVLFFVVPSRKRFVVLGDEGIHAKVGQEFWEAVVESVCGKFHEGDFTGGLVDGITEVGERLAEHFPYDAETDVNELPDAVDFGKED